jgi:plastocyanin
MNRTSWVVGGIVIAIAIIGALFFITHERAQAPAPEETGAGNAATGANGESVIIVYTDAGFSPATVQITPGTTITWSNQSTRDLAVVDASLSVDGCTENTASTALNQCTAVSSGGSYSYTAGSVGSIIYANRAYRGDTGTITVSSDAVLNPDATPQ